MIFRIFGNNKEISMKKILLFASIALFSATSYGQSLGIIEPVSTVAGTLAEMSPGEELVAAWNVQNISANFIEVRASRNVISAVQGSANYFCWGVCFGEETNVSPTSVNQDMNPGDINTTFYAHYISNENPGITDIEYCFFNAANSADRTCQTVRFCVDAECLVSVAEPIAEFEISDLSPNPLKGLGSIKYSFANAPANDTKLVIYNMVGKIVKETAITAKDGILFVNGEDFESGIYLYSVISNGRTLSTKRMVVAK
jgi:hypothetical protein